MGQTILDLNPSLALIPSAYKAGKLHSLIPADGSGDFTVSRNGEGSRTNKSGLIEFMPANVPRLEFHPVTGEFLGVLVEDAATNLASHSSNFSDAYWNKLNGGTGFFPAITTNHTTSPDGNLTADRIIFDRNGGNTSSDFSLISRGGLSFSSEGVFCIFVKSLTDVNQELLIYNGSATAGGVFTITPEWRKIVMTGVPSGNQAIAFGTRGGSGSVVNGGSQVLDVALWNAQPEIGSPTSPIPTTTAAVTRPSDIITVTVPAGATEVVYVNNGVQTTLPVTAGSTFQLPVGLISKLWMN